MCCSVCDSIALRGGGIRSADRSRRIDADRSTRINRRSADPDCYCCCFSVADAPAPTVATDCSTAVAVADDVADDVADATDPEL